MGKLIEQHITDFSGGITTDARTPDFRFAQLIQNFDAQTYKHKLIPRRSSASADGSASTSRKQRFLIASRSGTYTLFGLGVVSGDSKAEILMKSLSTGGSNDLDDSGWDSPSNNQSGFATLFDLFVYYQKVGKVYGARTNGNIWAFDPSSSTSFDDTADDSSISASTVAGGLVHSQNDIMFVGYDNKIAKNNNGSWTNTALTLPSDKIVTSLSEYGNYLAIGTRSSNSRERSRVYLWDMTATSWNENFDVGPGILAHIQEVDGELLTVSLISETLGSKLVIRQFVGNRFVIIGSFDINSTSTGTGEVAFGSTGLVPGAKQYHNNALYFQLRCYMNGTQQMGIWKLARQNASEPFRLTLDYVPNNGSISTVTELSGFYIVNDIVFQSYVSSSAYKLDRSEAANTYSHTSAIETVIINGGDSSTLKSMRGITVTFEPLPSAGQVVLKYKADSETSFTTLFTHTTDNDIKRSVNSTEVAIPNFREMTLRVESTGGAVITGIHYKAEETLEGKPY